MHQAILVLLDGLVILVFLVTLVQTVLQGFPVTLVFQAGLVILVFLVGQAFLVIQALVVIVDGLV